MTKSSAGPWRKANVAWAVSDPDSDLSLVRLELLNGTTVLQGANISVSGGSASGSTELKSRPTPTAVKITVTDGLGNQTIDTRAY